MTAPFLVIYLLSRDLIELYVPGTLNFQRNFGSPNWGFRSRANFILNHAIHIAFPSIIIAAHFLSPIRYCRPTARLLAAGYNAAILLLVVYHFVVLS